MASRRSTTSRKSSKQLPSIDVKIDVEELAKYNGRSGRLKLEEEGGVEKLAERLRVSLETGIEETSAHARQYIFGRNVLEQDPPKPIRGHILEALEDSVTRLLIVCAIISLILAFTLGRERDLAWIDGLAILVTVAVICTIQSLLNWKKELVFAVINEDAQQVTTRVIRDGVQRDIDSADVVVGDLVKLFPGIIIDANGILLNGDDVVCDETAIPFGSENTMKSVERSPFLLTGSSVTNGTGTFLVTAVGVNPTDITADVREVDEDMVGESDAVSFGGDSRSAGGFTVGASASRMSDASDIGSFRHMESDSEYEDTAVATSVLQKKLEAMVHSIESFAFGAAGIVASIMCIRHLFDTYVYNKKGFDFGYDAHYILEAFTVGIALVAVAVPEGLPMAVSTSLSLCMRKMKLDQNLVKQLGATETMGSATTIIVDKTGTLTVNDMTVTSAYIGLAEFQDSAEGCAQLVKDSEVPAEIKHKIGECICANKMEGTSVTRDTSAGMEGEWLTAGNKTECALLMFAHKLGFDYEKVRAVWASRKADRCGFIKSIPFDVERKRSSCIVPLTADPNGPCRVYVVGAAEIVLALSSKELLPVAGVAEFSLTADRRKFLNKKICDYAKEGLRVLSLAYRDFPSPPPLSARVNRSKSYENIGLHASTFMWEVDLTYITVLALSDPPRHTIFDDVYMSHIAGIDVRLVTGEHRDAAINVAIECGILRYGIDYMFEKGKPELMNPSVVMTGKEFRDAVVLQDGSIDLDAFDELWPSLKVLARSIPHDKTVLVASLGETDLHATELGRHLHIAYDKQVVAMISDDSEDVAALERAHVGFSKKATGTRVAQSAADIILLDENLGSILKACMWGRNVYDCITKFLQFQLTVNVSCVVITLLGAVVCRRAPFSVVQLLWVNLIMDSLGALALSAEAPTDNLLERPPYGMSAGLLSFEMIVVMVGQIVYQLLVLIFLMFYAAGPPKPSSLGEKADYTFEIGGYLNIESGIGRGRYDLPTQHFTMLFNTFVVMQLFNWINCRMVHFECNAFHGLTRNKMFMGIWLACVCIQVAAVQVPGVNRCFTATALDLTLWLFCLGAGVLTLVWGVILSIIGSILKPFIVKERDWRQVPMQDDGASIVLELEKEDETLLAEEDPCPLPPAHLWGPKVLTTIRSER